MKQTPKSWLPAIALATGVTFMVVPSVAKAAETETQPTPIKAEAPDAQDTTQTETVDENTVNFSNIGIAPFETDDTNHTVEIGNSGGDHFAMYNGIDKVTNDFSLEANVDFKPSNNNGNNSAAIVFGTASKSHPGTYWYAANVDTSRSNNPDCFRVFGAGRDIITDQGQRRDIDLAKTLYFKVDMTKEGQLTYTFGNADGPRYTMATLINGWQGGWIGLLSFNSDAVFSNVRFVNRAKTTALPQIGTALPITSDYHTNLSDASYQGGNWSIQADGLHSDATNQGDTFLFTTSKGKNFVYSTDIHLNSNTGAPGLLFKSNNNLTSKEAYAVNIDASSMHVKMWRWHEGEAMQLMDEYAIEKSANDTYTLKVVVIDNWIQYYVNDRLITSLGDFTLQRDDKGQPTAIGDGYYGLINWNANATYQNTYYQEISDNTDARIKDIDVTSTGTVEQKPDFNPNEPTRIQYVRNDASSVTIHVTPNNPNAIITAFDQNGNPLSSLENVALNEGANYITIVSTLMSEQGQKISATYRYNIHRLQKDDVYGNEPYRDQYHYSIREGWLNDPNGLVYFNGVYHMYHQFYDDLSWGPMHWYHLTSTDLIHWKEQPVVMFPDMNGTMFNGSIVVDTNNTSGLFQPGQSGLVALITADGNGQRLKLAYSTDGFHWTKMDKVSLDWLNDPLADAAFRDPKIFRWENQWFMVIAGGPLRIYSSHNLYDWKFESGYPQINTECPDLYPIQSSEGIKWVLNRGGRSYRVGDFKQINGKWTFVPDTAYENYDQPMNFGKDSYASMTYYVQDFGTSEKPTLPQLIEANWMNTWEYCGEIATKVGQKFNGTFTLNLNLGLTKDETGKWVLTQTPIKAYEDLRDEKIVDVKDAPITADNTILQPIHGDTYEIIATFKPTNPVTSPLSRRLRNASVSNGRVGFKLRTNNKGQETLVYYDFATGNIVIDRTKSGILINDAFKALNQQAVTLNEDGSITMHIYVDRASVEVFTKENTVAGTNQIFPDADALDAQIFTDNVNYSADVQVYTMKKVPFRTESFKTYVADDTLEAKQISEGPISQEGLQTVRVGTKPSVVRTPIKASIKYVADDTLEVGQRVETPGQDGSTIVTTTYTMDANGNVTANAPTTETVDPIETIVRVGTKPTVTVTVIPSPIVRENDDTLTKGQEVAYKGKDGSTTTTTTYIIDENGNVIANQPTIVTVDPTNTIIKVGTKEEVMTKPDESSSPVQTTTMTASIQPATTSKTSDQPTTTETTETVNTSVKTDTSFFLTSALISLLGFMHIKKKED